MTKISELKELPEHVAVPLVKTSKEEFQAMYEEKPKRVKVEYVECDRLQDALDKFESMSGFEFYPDANGVGDRINSVRNLALAYGNNSLYRRIETPIEWWEDLVEFINQSTGDSCASSANGETLHVRASMSRDKWCDFARILLEQGECEEALGSSLNYSELSSSSKAVGVIANPTSWGASIDNQLS